MNEVWDRRLTEKFIVILKKYPSLWDASVADYLSKKQRQLSLHEIYEEMLQFAPTIQIDTIRTKINSLRSQYTKELRTINDRIKRGKARRDSIRPSLWCFKHLDFLRPHVKTKLSECIIEDNSNDISDEHTNEIDESGESENFEFLNLYHNQAPIKLERKTHMKRKRKKSLDSLESLNQHKVEDIMLINEQDEVDDNSYDDTVHENQETIENSTLAHSVSIANDNNEIYGKCWAAEYSKLDEEQQIYAKRAIDEVLFQGRLGNLTKESTEIKIVST